MRDLETHGDRIILTPGLVQTTEHLYTDMVMNELSATSTGTVTIGLFWPETTDRGMKDQYSATPPTFLYVSSRETNQEMPELY